MLVLILAKNLCALAQILTFTVPLNSYGKLHGCVLGIYGGQKQQHKSIRATTAVRPTIFIIVCTTYVN